MREPDVLLRAPDDASTLSALALHGRRLYYTTFEPARVGVIDLDTGRAELLAQVPDGLSDLAVSDDGTLYLANAWARTVSRLAPGASAPEVIVRDPNAVRVAVSGQRIAWGGSTGASHAVRVGELPAPVPRTIASRVGSVIALSADAAGVVFATNAKPKHPGAVWAAGWGDAAATVLADGMRFCKECLRAADGWVYFAAEFPRVRAKDDGLWRVREGAAPERVAAVFDPRGFHVDDDGTIVGASYDGAVFACDLGGATRKLADLGVTTVRAVADREAVYVGAVRPRPGDRAQIFRVAR